MTKLAAILQNFLMLIRKESDNYNYWPNSFIYQGGQNELILVELIFKKKLMNKYFDVIFKLFKSCKIIE